MGRALFLSLLLVGWAACTPGPNAMTPVAEGQHEGLVCRDCHAGPTHDGTMLVGSMASVPAATCSSSDCHRQNIPAVVSMASVQFEHRGHADTAAIATGCAGCHTHDEGQQDLRAESESCALCHGGQLSGASAADCRVCHSGTPEGLTSQGVLVSHEEIRSVSGECVRCHFDVGTPDASVSMAPCSSCHTQSEGELRPSLEEELHPSHTGVTCTSCHVRDSHRIVAMSSSVRLECGDCHVESHAVTLEVEPFAAETCNECHGDEHAAQQALLLGFVDHDVDLVASEKFMDGVTCRSCHVPRSGRPADPTVGSPAGCTACHRAEYGQVLTWWEEGVEQRVDVVGAYLRAARGRLGASGTLDSAEAMLETVRAGGVHNLRLSHRLLAAALAEAGRAHTEAAIRAPAPPGLGREPSMGLCSYCHYWLGETRVSGQMDTIFHREVMGVGR